MPSWKGKTRGGKFGYSFFIFLLKNFNIPVAYFFAAFIAAYYYLTDIPSFKNTYFYFNKIHKYGFFKSVVNIYRNYHVFGKTLIDKNTSLYGKSDVFTYEFEGEDYFREVIANGKGTIFLSGHLGNWEVARHLLSRLGGKINLLMLDAEHQQIKKVLSEISLVNPSNNTIIPIKDDFSHLFEVNRVLKNGEILCIQADRFITNSKTVKVNFMGRPACFSTGPFFMALEYDVPVSYFFSLREPGKKYHFYAFPAKKPDSSLSKNEKITFMLHDYLSVFERFIRKYPEQWFNYYKFWETT